MFDTAHHGLRFLTVTTALTGFRIMATAVIGLVATAPLAQADAFPVGEPVLITDIPAAIADAGKTGTLAAALRAIDDQVKTLVVVVRVAPGDDENPVTAQGETDANVVAGVEALLTAEQSLGVKPRILGAPGLDTAPVAAKLAVVAPKLNAFAYAAAIGADIPARTAYRGTFAARELMLISGGFLAFNPDLEPPATGASWGVARALGLRARIDQEQGFNKTLSNVAVAGVLGLSEPISWDLQSSATDAGVLNAADVTCIIQRNGFRFWGNHTCADADDWIFESSVRTDQVLRDTIADGVFPYLDGRLTPGLRNTIVERINATFRELKRLGLIIGAECFYDPAMNPKESLAAGKLRLGYKFTDTPPLEDLGIAVERTNEYLAVFNS